MFSLAHIYACISLSLCMNTHTRRQRKILVNTLSYYLLWYNFFSISFSFLCLFFFLLWLLSSSFLASFVCFYSFVHCYQNLSFLQKSPYKSGLLLLHSSKWPTLQLLFIWDTAIFTVFCYYRDKFSIEARNNSAEARNSVDVRLTGNFFQRNVESFGILILLSSIFWFVCLIGEGIKNK